jgi:tRNA pseudouridine38-40 synthase
VRYFIQIKYNGTNYHGWQIQPNALTVQQEVDKTLSLFFKTPIYTLGCGRTDTGVHAEQFFAHFDIAQAIEDIPSILNKLSAYNLKGVQFQDIFEVPETLNARFDAISRTYEYRIMFQRNPFLENLALYHFGKLEIAPMQQAAALLLGKKDFGAFSKSNTQVNNNICDITEAKFIQKEELLIFTITANRFLRNMVRAIVGTLLEIGKGKRAPNQILEVLESQNRSKAGISVPACGLFLVKVEYPNFKNIC